MHEIKWVLKQACWEKRLLKEDSSRVQLEAQLGPISLRSTLDPDATLDFDKKTSVSVIDSVETTLEEKTTVYEKRKHYVRSREDLDHESERVKRFSEAQEADLQSSLEAWRTAETYADIIKINARFLRGDTVDITPYSNEPIAPETEGLVPELLRLHTYGLFTENSQPADYGTFWEKTEGWWEVKENAYIVFWLPTHPSIVPQNSVDKFCELVQKREDLNRSIATLHPEPKTIYQSTSLGSLCQMHRYASDKEDLERSDWTEEIIDFRDVRGYQDRWKFIPRPLSEANPLVITLISKTWNLDCRIGQIVEQMAQEAGISPSFDIDQEPVQSAIPEEAK
ncbi:MAG: hypothetical protein M1822_009938 [Bathelium mastoideum]|nr:MAG: hypothetical protein M1822_009938 [Bathelium mastoideum]